MKLIIKNRKTNRKHTLPFIHAYLVVGLVLLLNTAHAGFLVQPLPAPGLECLSCMQGKIAYQARSPYPKKHLAYKHYKHHRCHYAKYQSHPICMQSNDFVTFIGEPAPLNRGRWVNTDEYDYYDPDLSTGDDDPTIYPGMNIDN